LKRKKKTGETERYGVMNKKENLNELNAITYCQQ